MQTVILNLLLLVSFARSDSDPGDININIHGGWEDREYGPYEDPAGTQCYSATLLKLYWC